MDLIVCYNIVTINHKPKELSMYYELIITETAKDYPKQDHSESHVFNEMREVFMTIEEVKQFLKDHYGKMPGMRRNIYTDTVSGDTKVEGFLHSFWNKDWSHNTKSWFQTDWISINEVSSNPIDLKLLK